MRSRIPSCTLPRLLLLSSALLPTAALAQTQPDLNARHLPPDPPKRIIGDYNYASRYLATPYSSAQMPFDKLTHVIHAGVPFDDGGNLQVPTGFLEPELITRAHKAGVKVLLLIGGDVPALETNPAILKPLLKNLKKFVTENDYDGLDLDWEYPETTEDTATILGLMTALRETFPSPRYLLSIDAAPFQEETYDVPHMKKVVDWFNIMTYDCAGPWTSLGHLNAPIFWDHKDPEPDECQPGASDAESAKIFLKDAPASQLNQGTPFYGYWYTNINKLFGVCPNAATSDDGACDDTVQTVVYGPNIKPMLATGDWVVHRDKKALVPYLLRKDGTPGFITYDDAESTYLRVLYTDYVDGLGGTFLWDLDADYDGHSQDLLDAMYRATHLLPPAHPW